MHVAVSTEMVIRVHVVLPNRKHIHEGPFRTGIGSTSRFLQVSNRHILPDKVLSNVPAEGTRDIELPVRHPLAL